MEKVKILLFMYYITTLIMGYHEGDNLHFLGLQKKKREKGVRKLI